MPEPKTICEILVKLWADQNEQAIKSILVDEKQNSK